MPTSPHRPQYIFINFYKTEHTRTYKGWGEGAASEPLVVSEGPVTPYLGNPVLYRRAPLGDLIRPRREKAQPAACPDLPYIGMEHVESHTMRLLGTVPAATMKSVANRFYAGDVLYGRLRPYLNKVYRADFDGLCSAEFIVLPKTEGVDPNFLRYRLNLRDFVSFTTHLNAGDRPRVDFDQISPFEIEVPEPNEQRRIVAELETQLTRLDASVTALKRVQANLKRYRASVLACEGRLVPTEAELARRERRSYESGAELLNRLQNNRPSGVRKTKKKLQQAAAVEIRLPEATEGWAWATVEELAAATPNSVTDGPFGSNLKTEAGPRVIRLQNIGDGVFVDEHAHITSAHYERLKKHHVFAGDIVIAALGESPPRSCIVPESLGPAIVKADCVRFKPHDVLSAKLLSHMLNSEPTRARAKAIVHGIGVRD